MNFILTHSLLLPQAPAVSLKPGIPAIQALAAPGRIVLANENDLRQLTGSLRPTDRISSINVKKALAALVNKEPDGDTIKIQLPDGTVVAVRYLNGDTYETHFLYRKQGDIADRQTDANLAALGAVCTWQEPRGKVLSMVPDPLVVRLLVKGTDRYGRLLGMPLKHDADIGDIPEGEIAPDSPAFVRLLEASVNYYLTQTGNTFTTFYSDVTPVEIAVFLSALRFAQGNESGIHKPGADQTYTGLTVSTAANLKGNIPIHPVLFRRLVAYYSKNKTFDADGFIKFLRDNPDHMRRIKPAYTDGDIKKVKGKTLEALLETGDVCLHDIIEIKKAGRGSGFVIRLTEPMENFVRFN
ncbi:MAG: hypothetical protein HQM16_18375 [Deltaproteobacteria bacterium]|nr:hypothetical protein [Deltaproteobacteria bacterium]